MLHIDKSKLFRTAERKLAAGAIIAVEGKAAVAVYENGELTVKASTGASGEVFAGVMFSSKTPIETLPNVVTIRASGTTVTLPHTPIPGTVRVVGMTAGDPATTADQYSIAGNVITVHSSDANTDVTVQYTYSPTVLEAKSLQGDVEPGAALSSVTGMTGVIEGGEVFTTEFDTAADWSTATAVKLGADGKFTTAGSGTAVEGLITRRPGAGSPVLGLSFNI